MGKSNELIGMYLLNVPIPQLLWINILNNTFTNISILNSISLLKESATSLLYMFVLNLIIKALQELFRGEYENNDQLKNMKYTHSKSQYISTLPL